MWVGSECLGRLPTCFVLSAALCSACLPPALMFESPGESDAWDGSPLDADGGKLDSQSDAGGFPEGGVCEPNSTRCSDTGLPQKCNPLGSGYDDQPPCPSNLPLCDVATGACAAACTA